MNDNSSTLTNKLLKFLLGVDIKSGQNPFKEIAKVILEALAIVLLVQTFLYKPFTIPSQSMVPTLLVGDYVLVSKFKYGFSRYSLPFSVNLFEGRILGKPPVYGDVVVFRPPHDPTTDWVKRIVGLPGDKVKMIDGRLYINGNKLTLKPAGTHTWRDQHEREFTSNMFIETGADGRKYKIIKHIPFGEAAYDNTPEYTVPEGHFFLMGDDRDFSSDCRVLETVGFIPYDHIVGEAQLIFFSTELPTKGGAWWQIWRWLSCMRFDRIINIVR